MKLQTNTAVGMKILYDRISDIARRAKQKIFMAPHVKLNFENQISI